MNSPFDPSYNTYHFLRLYDLLIWFSITKAHNNIKAKNVFFFWKSKKKNHFNLQL